MQNQEIIVLLIFHVVYNCLLPLFASMFDEYRAMTVYANNNCDDLSAQKKRFHRFPDGHEVLNFHDLQTVVNNL